MRKVTVLFAVAMLALVGCSTNTKTEQSQTSTDAICAFDNSVGGVTAVGGGNGGADPILEISKNAEVPTELQVSDLCTGEGVTAELSDSVTVDYIGVDYKTQETFDTTYGSGGQPATFQLSQTIPGFQQGIVGMKPGGVRLLRIPSDMAYGDPATRPGAPAGALAFLVVMRSIDKASSSPSS